jgi:ankyrin repeat protein
MIMAAQQGHTAMVRCLVTQFGVDINQAPKRVTALYIAARQGHDALVRCIVEELGADVNQAMHDGRTPLMAASAGKHKMVAKFLIKHGADPQASSFKFGTAVDAAQIMGAPAHQKAYLEAKAHCASPSCGGMGVNKCTRCKRARYCSQQCQLAHWPAHKIECKKMGKIE